MPLYSYNNKHRAFARNLRKNQTEAEKLLWSKLRSRQLLGYKFRRQQPIENFILDFYCEEKKLGIELDGSQHQTSYHKIYDYKRTLALEQDGIRIIRFFDNEVFENFNGVINKISETLTSP